MFTRAQGQGKSDITAFQHVREVNFRFGQFAGYSTGPSFPYSAAGANNTTAPPANYQQPPFYGSMSSEAVNKV